MLEIIEGVLADSTSWPSDRIIAKVILEKVVQAGMRPPLEPFNSLVTNCDGWEPEPKLCKECRGSGLPTRKHSDLDTVCVDCGGTGEEK